MGQETFFTLIHALGSIGFLLFGMNVMKRALGESGSPLFDKTLAFCTASDTAAVLFGTVITAIVQSSTAITVTVVGLVDAKKLPLRRAIGVILGANVGTCITSWLLSLTGLSSSHPVLVLLQGKTLSSLAAIGGGVLLLMESKGKKTAGQALLGFSLTLFSVSRLSELLSPLAQTEGFRSFFLLFANPLFGILAGTVITALLQSSSASIGILQALSQSGIVSVSTAIPIILGQNIGTTITAMIASAGTSPNAKRSAFIHFYINLLGATVFLMISFVLQYLPATAPTLASITNPAGVAWIHTVFNVVSTVALLPFIGYLEQTAMTVGAKKISA